MFGTNPPKVHHKKISYMATVEPPINQGTIERFWDYFYAIYLLFNDSIRYRCQKMHQIEVETLTLKYDIIDLELRGSELRNGTSVKNWARDYVGGSPMRSVLLLLLLAQWRCWEDSARRVESEKRLPAVPIPEIPHSPFALRWRCSSIIISRGNSWEGMQQLTPNVFAIRRR